MGNTAVCWAIQIVKQRMITVTYNVGSTKILCLKLVPDSSVITDGVKWLGDAYDSQIDKKETLKQISKIIILFLSIRL